LSTGDPSTIRKCSLLAERLAARHIRTKSAMRSVVNATLGELLGVLKAGEVPADSHKCVADAVQRVTRRRRKRLGQFHLSGVDPRGPSPSDDYENRELAELVFAVLEQLPAPLPYAMIAIILEGRTAASVAAELGIEAATLRKQLTRARRAVQKQIDRDGIKS